MTGWIRVYDAQPIALCSDTCGVASETPPAPFPSFTRLPPDLHVFSYSQRTFAPPDFKANDCSTPWLLFDDQANALIVSPASHFMVASMQGNGRTELASGFTSELENLPKGFTQQTLLAFGEGINATWDLWGRTLTGLEGAKRPGNEADDTLKYLGYWTDNGAYYYYNYDPKLGYAGTLQSLVERYRREQIPIRYLQLDSWWYYKSRTGPDGEIGAERKSTKFPEGEWNRYGGMLEYKAHPFLFPQGLGAFQESIDLPLVTHNRWIDLASPYREKYRISGVAAVDPKWWDDITAYLKANGVVTYEQDWLDRIYRYSPAFSSNLDTAEQFLGDMARACAEKGLTMQYCMPYPCFFLQGSRYPNLTTIRTSNDRFGPSRWNNFLYVSRLASALGIWPWADVYRSTETNNLLLSTLSAGPVGIGDAIGSEDKDNLLKAVRADGAIVKPDVPIVPLDRSYLDDARRINAPLVAGTFTDQGGIKTAYVFAFNRTRSSGDKVRFKPAALGLAGPVVVYDYFDGNGHRMNAEDEFSAPLRRSAAAYYIIAPVAGSGIAFLGDRDKFVSTGRQRIVGMQNRADGLTVRVLFAANERAVFLHGYASLAPAAKAIGGEVAKIDYSPATQHFVIEVKPDVSSPLEPTTGVPVRLVTVTLMSGKKPAK